MTYKSILALWLMGSLFGLGTASDKESVRQAEPQARLLEKEVSYDLGNGVKLELVLIRAGSFMMGSASESHDGPYHEVTITNPFYIGKYEVTQAQWKALTGENPSAFKEGADADKRPVEAVSWSDIQEKFLPKLAGHLPKGWIPRLPTEAEWEYSCRAASATAFCFGDNADGLNEYGWYDGNSGKTTHPVGEKKPNAWGLYDMHGNVWEWCSDWKVAYPAGSVTDPAGPATGSCRANRGGSWYFNASYSKSARRSLNEPNTTRSSNLGFRVVLSVQ